MHQKGDAGGGDKNLPKVWPGTERFQRHKGGGVGGLAADGCGE